MDKKYYPGVLYEKFYLHPIVLFHVYVKRIYLDANKDISLLGEFIYYHIKFEKFSIINIDETTIKINKIIE